MKISNLAAIAFLLFACSASSQTFDELKSDGENAENVTTYGIGYYLQRFSLLN